LANSLKLGLRVDVHADDFLTALRQQRQASAMIEVGMSQEHIIDAGGIKAEWL